MLPAIIDHANEVYAFMVGDEDGFRILFGKQATFTETGRIEFLWARSLDTKPALEAVRRWFGVRRDLWQKWGVLAEAVGQQAFDRHIMRLLEADPPATALGTFIRKGNDPSEIVLGETLHGRDGIVFEQLYRHRFAAPADRDSFFEWLHTARNTDCVRVLIDIAFTSGMDDLDLALDRLAKRFATSVGARRTHDRKARDWKRSRLPVEVAA